MKELTVHVFLPVFLFLWFLFLINGCSQNPAASGPAATAVYTENWTNAITNSIGETNGIGQSVMNLMSDGSISYSGNISYSATTNMTFSSGSIQITGTNIYAACSGSITVPGFSVPLTITLSGWVTNGLSAGIFTNKITSLPDMIGYFIASRISGSNVTP